MSEQSITPPALAGFHMIEHIGSGGFAEVYLYEQRMPRRSVAVKVLTVPTLDTVGRERFHAEANVMAQLSSHSAIMTVYSAGIADDGSPYIVMEHCPLGSLGDSFRGQRMPVAEVLSIGVSLASALETAHRAGVLHRDVKPANILRNEFGAPLLTDFGISAAAGLDPISGEESLSVPWSPPEFLRTPVWSGPSSDVYALAATLYSLVTGHAPFETAAGPNDVVSQAARIRSQAAPPVGIDELDEVFEVAMARSPQARYTSALAFGRALQGVQRRLGLPETELQFAGRRQLAQPAADETVTRASLAMPTATAPVTTTVSVRDDEAAETDRPQQRTQSPSELDVFEPAHEVRVHARGELNQPRTRTIVGGWGLDGALLFVATLLVALVVTGAS